MHSITKRLLGLANLLFTTQMVFGGSATWDLNPANNDWATAANWTPETVPYGVSDVATFGSSSVTEIAVGDSPDGTDLYYHRYTSL